MDFLVAICVTIVVLVLCRSNLRSIRTMSVSSKTANIDASIKVPKEWDWGKITKDDAALWEAHFGKRIAVGCYTSPVFDQHMSKWCGACYLVSVLQMLQDRFHIELGVRDAESLMFPCYQLNFQLALDTYNAHATMQSDGGWNACKGGSPMKVLQAITEDKCLLEFTSDDTVWLGHPTQMEDVSGRRNASVTLEPLELLDSVPNNIQYRIFKYGPVVLGIDSRGLLDKKLTRHGGVIDTSTIGERDHAVTVVGWKTIKGAPCWIVRNSWGTTTVPVARPDAACVGENFNECDVDTQDWTGDEERPGYAYVPFSYGGLRGPPSPWFDGIPKTLSRHLMRDHAVEPIRAVDDFFTRAYPRVHALSSVVGRLESDSQLQTHV